MPSQNPQMSIALSSGNVLCSRHECGDFDLDLGTLIDQASDVEQRRRRETLPQRLAPGSSDTCARGFVFPAAGQIPGEADDVLGTGARLREQLDDSPQRDRDLPGHVGPIFTLLVAAGLAGQHSPSPWPIYPDTARETAWLHPFSRSQRY